MLKRILFITTILFLTNLIYSYNYEEDYRWATPSMPIGFKINPDGAPSGAIDAICAAFCTWENAAYGWISFDFLGTTSSGVQWFDDENTLCWGYVPEDGIAVAWPRRQYQTSGPIVECDVAFNENYAWSATPSCPSNKYDVQNVATHEVGHWLYLFDLYDEEDKEKTMYFEGETGETKKRTLEPDDIAGVRYIYSVVRVPDDYSSIQAAVDNTLPGQKILVMPVAYEISGTIPAGITLLLCEGKWVASGETLTLLTGSKVDLGPDGFDPYYVKSTGGTIIRQDGVTILPKDISVMQGTEYKGFYSTVQSAIYAASSGQDVYLGDGFYLENLYMKSGVDVYGSGTDYDQTRLNSITFRSGTSVSSLSHARVVKWIEMDNCPAICAVENVLLEDGGNIGTGIDINQSFSAVLSYVVLSGQYCGIYSHGTSYPGVYDCSFDDMGYEGAIKMANYGTMNVIGTLFCNSLLYDILEIGSATIYATYCTWSDYPPETMGNVSIYPEPTYQDVCGFYRRLAKEPPVADLPADVVDADEETYREAYEIFEAARQSLLDDWRAGKEVNPQAYAGELTVAIDRFKALAAECDGPVSIRAMGAVAACYGLLENNEAAYDYLTYIANTSRYAPLKPYAQSLLVGHYRREGDFETALALADEILAGSADDPSADGLAGETLYTKGLIYERDLGDSTRAAEMYAAMVRDYSEHPTTFLAVNRLEEMDLPVPEPAPKEAEPEVTELSLSGYPNPFNPTTTVRFGLPEAGDVTLIVYDLMGREVVRLAEGYREAGWQQVIWDGRNASGREVPTGMYLARLVTPQGVKALKLVMMK